MTFLLLIIEILILLQFLKRGLLIYIYQENYYIIMKDVEIFKMKKWILNGQQPCHKLLFRKHWLHVGQIK